jgi:hypothetical protein
VVLQMPDKTIAEVPCGMVVWAAVSLLLFNMPPNTPSYHQLLSPPFLPLTLIMALTMARRATRAAKSHETSWRSCQVRKPTSGESSSTVRPPHTPNTIPMNYVLNPPTEYLHMAGTGDRIFAIGDCTASSYAPTAQVASQQGAYLARMLAQMAKQDTLEAKVAEVEAKLEATPAAGTNETAGTERKALEEEEQELRKQLGKVKLRPFHYSHQGSLA